MSIKTYLKGRLNKIIVNIKQQQEEKKELQEKIKAAVKAEKEKQAIKTEVCKIKTDGKQKRKFIRKSKNKRASGTGGFFSQMDSKIDYQRGIDGIFGKPIDDKKKGGII